MDNIKPTMRISSESIEAIMQAADIRKVVGQHTTLMKKGGAYVAHCPFEWCLNSGMPLLFLNAESNLYKCFCCGAVGDPIKFIMDIMGISYGAALRELADRLHIEVIEESITKP